jgi:CubicO group peptidase (beta-lactamase class C family)
MELHGFCNDEYTAVADAFGGNFDQGLEVGASVAVTVDGEPVVDMWAGDADPRGTKWERDTIINVYSTTKTMAAICMLMLADRGQLDFDAPVAKYWPEFAQNGKDAVLVRHVMSHTAGVSGFDPPIAAAALYDWDRIVDGLAAQTPWWEPGTASGYHAITQGYLQGEILRRIDGRTMGTFFRDEVAVPLGADFHIGLPESEDSRVAELIPPVIDMENQQFDPNSIAGRTLLSCLLDATEPRTRAWRGAEIPAAGGTGYARSVARAHSALACGGTVDGVRLMGPEMVERVLEPQIDGKDLVLELGLRHGMGFGLWLEDWITSPNPRHFFWGGYGGSVAIVDLDARMSIAYVMNRMDSELTGDQRGKNIVKAVYASTGKQ